ncbi:PaaI family thioesterase [bacterium]|nr:PaaI family thioesterase [bacterium]
MARQLLEKPGKFSHCYGCGSDNARGLGLVFWKDGDRVSADFVPAPEHGGYGKIVHGGVTAAMIDEAFGWAIFGLLGKLGMTTRIDIELLGPIFCGTKVVVTGTVEKDDAREAHVRADVLDAEGKLAARARGTMRYVSKRAVELLAGFSFGADES